MTGNGPTQGVLDFDAGGTAGFETWRQQQEARLEAIRREWSVPLGRRVRIRLRNIDGDFEGKLQLAQQPATIDRREPLHMRVGRVDVFIPDIEQCTVLD
jgi:hypothetical protein